MITGRYLHLGSILCVGLLVVFLCFGPTHGDAETLPQDTLPPLEESISERVVQELEISRLLLAQPGTDVNVSNLTGNESEVSIDVNPTNPLNQVIVGHSGETTPPDDFRDMNTFFTTDGGQTWTLVALSNAEDGLTSIFRFDPTVAFDENGNVYAAYGVRTPVPAPGGGNQRTVVVCQSTNGGQSYPQCTLVATTADIGTLPGNDKWHLATGPDPSNPSQQNVYIAWTQNIREAAGTDQRIVLSASTDGGATFSAPVIINDPSISGTRSGNLFADPGVGPNGEVYVAWHDINAGQVFVDVSLDGGTTFGTDVLVTNSNTGFKTSIPAQFDRGVFVGPTLDVDRSGGAFNGRVYVTYTDAQNIGPPVTDTDIFVRSSPNGGATWSGAVLVNDDGGSNDQFLPWLDVDQQTGVVSVVWYDARNDTNNNGTNNQLVEVFMAISDDGGATFGTNILVSDGQSDQSTNNPNRWGANYLEYIGIAMFDCEAYPVWADNSTNLADLDFFTDQVQLNGLDTSICNQPPVAMCQDVTVSANDQCLANASVDAGSFDPEDDPITLTQDPPELYPLGDTLVTLTVEDDQGASDTCTATVTVVDDTPPEIECNSPPTITPPDAPISFTATATDNCGVSSVMITEYDCFKFTKKGKRIDKTESCEVAIAGDTVTILDSGGVGDNITWTVRATDSSGNETESQCAVVVVNPGRGH